MHVFGNRAAKCDRFYLVIFAYEESELCILVGKDKLRVRHVGNMYV